MFKVFSMNLSAYDYRKFKDLVVKFGFEFWIIFFLAI